VRQRDVGRLARHHAEGDADDARLHLVEEVVSVSSAVSSAASILASQRSNGPVEDGFVDQAPACEAAGGSANRSAAGWRPAAGWRAWAVGARQALTSVLKPNFS
jgi:hypothetical protein